MKKIIISIATISVFIFTSCFTDTDTATVKINLGNIPLAKTAKIEKKSIIDRFVALFLKEAVAQPEVPEWTGVKVVHLGAFDANNQLLAKKSVTAMWEGEPVEVNTVEFDVPARSGITIVVLGESTQNDHLNNPDPAYKIFYYGKNETPLNLTADSTEEVNITMFLIESYTSGQQLDYLKVKKQDPRYKWEVITGAKMYSFYHRHTGDHLHSTTDIFYEPDSFGPGDNPFFEIEFQITDKKSRWIICC